MSKHSLGNVVILIVVLLPLVNAQSPTGTLQGVVRDPSGAPIPGSSVTLTNVENGVRTQLTTNAEGRFVGVLLPPALYSLTAEKEGFRRYVRTGIRLNVQQDLSADVSMELGDLAAQVEVSSEAPLLETNTATVAAVVNTQLIQDLPLNGRDTLSLAYLSPGVIGGGGQNSTPWISGGRNSASEVTVDGTSIILPANAVSLGDLAYKPPVDGVQEFSVITNTPSAEYGHTQGGVLNVVTKAGTNTLHGSAYDFLRNSAMDANNFFSNRARVPLASLQRNQFGGTLGGPVWIPKVYKGVNRTFFFFNYQGTRQRTADVAALTVPLDAWKRGDFSTLRNPSGQPVTIYDPLTTKLDPATGNYIRDAFPGNVIPSGRINPVARNLMKYYPLPNSTPVNPYSQLNNYVDSGKAATNNDSVDVRLDHSLSERWRSFFRISVASGEAITANHYYNIANPGIPPTYTNNYSLSWDHTWTINPSMLLNARYGFGRMHYEVTPNSLGFDFTELGLPASMRDVAARTAMEFPRFDGLASLGTYPYSNLVQNPMSHVLQSNLTKIFSRHTLKFGGEYRKQLLNFLQLGAPSGQFSFDARWTQANPVVSSPVAGYSLSSMLIGIPTSGQMTHEPVPAQASSYWAGFIQDDFKVSRMLTINLGLRYDVDVPRTERYNQLSYFDLTAPSPIAGKVPGYPNLTGAMRFASPGHRHQTPTDRNNVAPRFGFALTLGPKTVFRGGYGILYGASAMQASGSTGNAGLEGFRSITGYIASLDSRTPITSLSDPFIFGYSLPQGRNDGPYSGVATNLGLSIGESYFLDYVNPVIQQWNGTLQQQLPGNVMIEVGYIASKGNHLIDGENGIQLNQLPVSAFALRNTLNDLLPNPFYGVIVTPGSTLAQKSVTRAQLMKNYPQYTQITGATKPQGNSLYHSLTIRAEKRYSHGLSLVMAFTGGKLIDDVSSSVSFLGQTGNNKQDYYNRAADRSLSSQDVSRQLTLGFTYAIPAGRAQRLWNSPIAQAVLGGWQVNGIFVMASGIPLLVRQPQNNSGLGSPGQRPNNNGTTAALPDRSRDEEIKQWFNTSVFSISPAFTFGNLGRLLPDVRTPSNVNIDLSMFKNFAFFENRLTLQLRGEAFNATNTTHLGGPGTTITSSTYGVINSAYNPRQIQIALKAIF
ncbi:MAG: carboxypeptidase regulatory-like domain-containing protein [Bryobacterales bacterium]|nr:carboxypeptidase regulatory-like domain-containing protein [Bryobacterales bacterium]